METNQPTTTKKPATAAISRLIGARLPHIKRMRRIDGGVGNIDPSIHLYSKGIRVARCTYREADPTTGIARYGKGVEVSYSYGTLNWRQSDSEKRVCATTIAEIEQMLIDAGYRVERDERYLHTLIIK